MRHFIDRRGNPKDKSLGNRQRFLRRAHARIKEAIDRSLKERDIADVANGETITIPSKGIDEPRFRHDRSRGTHDGVLPGNHEYVAGDKIDKPEAGEGGGAGKKGAKEGEGEDEFRFALTRDEFLNLFFEDLELPDLIKTDLKDTHAFTVTRAGYATAGTPANLHLLRTMRNSFGRRLALKRPKTGETKKLERRIFEAESHSNPSPEERQWLAQLYEELKELNRRRRAVPFLDPVDVRYSNFRLDPAPNTKAVMFCLMDVSGSMGEREKDLAKRFFMLLHLFLKRRYERIDLVFIRHTHEAKEVDEETFFHSAETGGTVVSTALTIMNEVMRDRYPSSQWNIYAAQASDGENYSGDSEKCLALLDDELMPACQYFAYVEIIDEREMAIFGNAHQGGELWRAYQLLAARRANFATKRISGRGDIYPVFRELFAKRPRAA